MRKFFLFFGIIVVNTLTLSAHAHWFDGDRFHELKEKLLSQDRELFEELCTNKEIQWHWMNMYFIPSGLNERIEHSLKMYQDELDAYLKNSRREKLT